MSGGREFDERRFIAMVLYFLNRHGRPMVPSKLAWLMFHADMEGYRRLGKSLSGSTYLKGYDYPEVAEAGWGWFERTFWFSMRSWVRPAGWLLTLYAFRASWKAR